jgi:hypothetical protein
MVEVRGAPLEKKIMAQDARGFFGIAAIAHRPNR